MRGPHSTSSVRSSCVRVHGREVTRLVSTGLLRLVRPSDRSRSSGWTVSSRQSCPRHWLLHVDRRVHLRAVVRPGFSFLTAW